MLTVQFLKNLSTTVIPKQLTLRGRHRGKGGSSIRSSLPRHGTRIKTETQKKQKNKKNKKNKKTKPIKTDKKTKSRLQVSNQKKKKE